MLKYYVVQAFAHTRMGALVPDAPIQAQDAAHALRLADRLSLIKSGVVAFSRKGNPATGEYEDADILICVGEVPALEHPVSLAS